MEKRLPMVAAGLGLFGSVACSVAMVLALVGLLGAGAASTASMAGMSADTSPALHSSLPAPLANVLFFLVQTGPVILMVSVASLALAVATRRRAGLLPMAAAGIVLYWGMYLQASQLVMFAAIVVGLVAMAGTYTWSTRPVKSASC